MTLDPSVFRPEAIDAETAVFVTELEQMLTGFPSLNTQAPADVRKARAGGGGGRGPIICPDRARERKIPGPTGEVTLRTFTPARVDGVYLHVHGGGWVLGSADAQDPRLEALSNARNPAVLSLADRPPRQHAPPARPPGPPRPQPRLRRLRPAGHARPAQLG